MKMAMCRSKWVLPVSIVALGIAMFAAEWIGGHPEAGIYAGAVIVAWGFFIMLAGVRSETMRALRGDGGDERFRMINAHATAFSGFVLIVALIVLWMIEVARGHDGNPYGALSALGGISYLVALLFMRWRG
jgi:NADH:ubiquinone oxidoreductase subunit 6 (subunit J)